MRKSRKLQRITLVVIVTGPITSGRSKRVSAATIVIPEVVVQVERLAALQRDDAVRAPAIRQLLHAAAPIWEFRTEKFQLKR